MVAEIVETADSISCLLIDDSLKKPKTVHELTIKDLDAALIQGLKDIMSGALVTLHIEIKETV